MGKIPHCVLTNLQSFAVIKYVGSLSCFRSGNGSYLSGPRETLVMKTDTDKINALRKLTGTVVENTKREIEGKNANASKESRAVSAVLEILLGRSATPEEVQFAQAV